MAYWHKRINDFSTSSDIALLIRSVTPLAYIISHSEPFSDSISFEAVVMFSLPFRLFILTQEQILVHQEELNRLVSYASNKIYLRQIRYCYNNHGRTNQITSSLRMSA